MGKVIIHIDMDAFYAAVEVRDDPKLLGLPLIIGALPSERGVVATCSYEARKYGIRSAMSIKDAYRRCPHGVYMHPNSAKYKEASEQIHKIWLTYTDLVEYISLDEGFLDVTGSAAQFGGARKVGLEIKRRTVDEVGLTCSVGIGYSKTSAKIASEEKKPDGFFEIPNADVFKKLICNRGVRVIYGVGPKTAEILHSTGINTVQSVLDNKPVVIELLGNQGKQIIDIAQGVDERPVIPYYEAEAKSISRETTFQQDITDFDYLKDALRLLAKELSMKVRLEGIFAKTITLKVKYANMKLITRSKSGKAVNEAKDIFDAVEVMLDAVEKRPIRLVGIGLSGFDESDFQQLTFDDLDSTPQGGKRKKVLSSTLLELQKKFGSEIIKTGNELIAEKRFKTEEKTKGND